MKKALKIFGKIMLGIAVLFTLFLIVMTIYNQIMLKKNKSLYDKPIGQLVEVDGHNMSIYTEGQGDHTLVFLSGWGTPSPILDFKPLYSKLSDDYRIVVIEKFGYGFSDAVDSSRDFDTILRQDREVLEKAGIEGPYVLCPHSLSGLEATLWEQKYPEEVEAVIGLDMSVANYPGFSDYEPGAAEKIAIWFSKAARATGVMRLINVDDSGTLSKEEKDIYTEIACRVTCNDTVISENKNIDTVCDEINNAPMPDRPTLQYLSGDNKNDSAWRDSHGQLVAASSNGQLVQLDCGHYVHQFESERISREMKDFINGLDT